MKISKSDTFLTSEGNNIFDKGNCKILGKKINIRFPYFSIKRNGCGQESKTGYSSNRCGAVNEG